MSLLFWALCLLGFFAQTLNLFLLGKGVVNHWLMLVVYSIYFVVETWIAFEPQYTAVMMFNLINIWGVIQAVRGIVRKKLTEGYWT